MSLAKTLFRLTNSGCKIEFCASPVPNNTSMTVRKRIGVKKMVRLQKDVTIANEVVTNFGSREIIRVLETIEREIQAIEYEHQRGNNS